MCSVKNIIFIFAWMRKVTCNVYKLWELLLLNHTRTVTPTSSVNYFRTPYIFRSLKFSKFSQLRLSFVLPVYPAVWNGHLIQILHAGVTLKKKWGSLKRFIINTLAMIFSAGPLNAYLLFSTAIRRKLRNLGYRCR